MTGRAKTVLARHKFANGVGSNIVSFIDLYKSGLLEEETVVTNFGEISDDDDFRFRLKLAPLLTYCTEEDTFVDLDKILPTVMQETDDIGYYDHFYNNSLPCFSWYSAYTFSIDVAEFEYSDEEDDDIEFNSSHLGKASIFVVDILAYCNMDENARILSLDYLIYNKTVPRYFFDTIKKDLDYYAGLSAEERNLLLKFDIENGNRPCLVYLYDFFSLFKDTKSSQAVSFDFYFSCLRGILEVHNIASIQYTYLGFSFENSNLASVISNTADINLELLSSDDVKGAIGYTRLGFDNFQLVFLYEEFDNTLVLGTYASDEFQEEANKEDYEFGTLFIIGNEGQDLDTIIRFESNNVKK